MKKISIVIIFTIVLMILSSCKNEKTNSEMDTVDQFEEIYLSVGVMQPAHITSFRLFNGEEIATEDIYFFGKNYWVEECLAGESRREGNLYFDGVYYHGYISSFKSFPLQINHNVNTPDLPWLLPWKDVKNAIQKIEKQEDDLIVVCEINSHNIRFFVRNNLINRIECINNTTSTDKTGQDVQSNHEKIYDFLYISEEEINQKFASYLSCVASKENQDAVYFAVNCNEQFDTGGFIIPKNATELTQKEMTKIEQTVFNSSVPSNIGQRFLLSWYNTPEDVNLLDIFSGGSRPGKEFPDNEFNRVAALYGDISREDLRSITALEMNDILQKYIGIPLKQTNSRFLDYLTYLDEYDTYYIARDDTNMCQIKLLKGYRNSDGTVIILYERQRMYAWYSELGIVTLRQAPTELGYYFTSNLPYGTEAE